MKEKMAVCGYRCDLCPVHKDNVKRIGKEEVKAGFIKYFNHELDFDVSDGCQGCPADGDENCTVKTCAREKEIANCGLCEEFPCGRVQEKMDVVKKCFDDVSALPARDRELFVEPYQSQERLRAIKQNRE